MVAINEFVKTSIAVTRENGFVRSGMDVVDEIEIYQGKENRLTMNQTYSKEFKCTYLIHWFPFDTQVSLELQWMTFMSSFYVNFYSKWEFNENLLNSFKIK